jgi:signal transduction histidine kinase
VTRRIVLGAMVFTAVVLAILAIPLGLRFAETEEYRVLVALERDAGVIADLVEDELEDPAVRAIEPPIGDYAERSGVRVIVTDASGIVLHDSDGVAGGRDFTNRPEIAAALEGRREADRRPSETLGQDLLYVAEPVTSSGRLLGTVRLTYTASELAQRIRDQWTTLALSGVAVLFAAAVAAVVLARWVAGPTRELAATMSTMTEGNLDVRAADDRGPREVRDVAARFNELTRRLAELIELQRRFAADASHQLRSPLTALRLELEELEAEQRDAGRDAAVVRAAIDEADRLESIIAGLLELARTERSPTSQDDGSEGCDLVDVVRGRLRALEPIAASADVRVLLGAGDAGAATVAAPAEHVGQIVDNLVSNAVRHAPRGSEVHLTVAPHGDEVRLDVRDHGPGLSGVERLRAFDRFWRAPDAEPGTGSGLGLPIARALARRAGGDVEFVDPPEDGGPGGVVARVRLPAACGSASTRQGAIRSPGSDPAGR